MAGPRLAGEDDGDEGDEGVEARVGEGVVDMVDVV
jgi:hypothetical protein